MAEQVETTLVSRQQPDQQALTPIEMISSVVQRGADPDALEKVTAWAERMQANEARRAYAQAITNFKAICPTIARNAKGHTNSYATLVSIDEQVRPALTQCQLSPSWRVVKNDKDWIEVECRITHVMGHYESTTFGGPPDTGPGRNALQARASTVSYLERYTLKALLGLVDKDMTDNDGSDGAPTPPSAKAKSQAAIDPTEKKAREQFRAVANRKAGVELANPVLRTLLANVQKAMGGTSVAECTKFIDKDSILVGKDGTLGFVTQEVDPNAFDKPIKPEDVAGKKE